MSRRLIQLIQRLEIDSRLKDSSDTWLNVSLGELPEDLLNVVQSIIAEGRRHLYKAPGCANIQLVDVLYMVGIQTRQYHIKQLVLQTRKGKIHIPSPFGGTLIPKEPVWRKHIPILAVY